MLKKIINILLIVLFFTLPLFNSHLIDLSGIKWGFYVSGNYEFSKTVLFNILSSIIISLYLIKTLLNKKIKKIIVPNIVFIFIFILSISTYFSLQPFTSLFGDNEKSHSLVMFINLIGIFIILINSKFKLQKKLLITSLISSIFIGIIGIKEYYFPTFDYGNLENRALSTLGHPNYLALYILILLPFLNPLSGILSPFWRKRQQILYGVIFILFLFVLVLTKSLWGIIIGGIYLIYKWLNIWYNPSLNSFLLKKEGGYKKIYLSIIIIFILLSIIYIINSFGYTKLHSFLSRFYIWETTVNIIFSDIKIFLFGGGLGTLDQIFAGFKSPLLYIYENIGYTADRPHNIFLNFFYHLGIGGLMVISYFLFKLIKNYKSNPYYESLILFFIFSIFNFPGIVHYLIIVLIGSIIYIKKKEKIYNFNKYLLLSVMLLISIIGGINSINYFKEEHKVYLDKYYKSDFIIFNIIESEDIKKRLFKNDLNNLKGKCRELVEQNPSVENYFFCGDIFWEIDKGFSKKLYIKGLNKLPDMWNDKSNYYNNIIVKEIFSEARFYSPKFSNIEIILNRVGIKK